MSLASFVQNDVLKLNARLAKQGVADIAAMDYSQYLRSTLWGNIREWVLKRDNYTCVVCRRESISESFRVYNNGEGETVKTAYKEFEVHHRKYDLPTLEGKDDSQLITLCQRCHKRIEFFSNGDRRFSIAEKENEYQRLLSLHQSIVKFGLAINLEEISKRGVAVYSIKYIGNPSYLEFYSLDSLISKLYFDFWLSDKDRLRIPLPWNFEKLHQPSGVPIIDKKSNRSLIKFFCFDQLAQVKPSKNCNYPVKDILLSSVEQSKYWHIES